MSAVVDLRSRVPVLAPGESRDFRAYHEFLRAARNYMESDLLTGMHDRWVQASQEELGRPPRSLEESEQVMGGLPEFALYNWYFRHLQRFKYHRPSLGIFALVERERERLEAGLAEAEAATPPERLRLNPDLRVPEYFRFVPFHQHTGGVTHDALDGISYEIGRRTTVPSHADPNGIYRLLFATFPQRPYAKVLDWGVGHGAALITWQQLHPESECHGVDLSAPCLRLANRRAWEQGCRFFLSQQDLEHLDYPDDSFDLIFFNFMLHEVPPSHTPALLREARRVLKPGGLFAGHEFHLRPGDFFQNVVQRSHGWANNETYSVPWYSTPIERLAREAGFSKVEVRPFERLNRSVERPGRPTVNANWWNLYTFEK